MLASMNSGINGVTVEIEGESGPPSIDERGDIALESPDGSVTVTIGANAGRDEHDRSSNDHYANLALDAGDELSALAEDLYVAIEEDDRSRGEWLSNRARALDLLGLRLREPKGDVTGGVEGMSTVTATSMLDAMLKGWASSVGEFLPAEGPIKVADRSDAVDELADVLERDLNYWLTNVATEYYPDTSHMLLWGPYFGGSGFKKIYRCPLRRRPVSEAVAAEDLIVSDTMRDLASCGRITHQITMRPSVMARMQRIGAYREIDLPIPSGSGARSEVEEAVRDIQGTRATSRPEDQPYTLWECQCELVLNEHAPREMRDVPLPYLVTLDRDSHELLALRRDWREDDPMCERERMYVRYPFVPGPGFYGTGLAQILGNATAAMTAAWREALDAGMYASFSAGLIDKMAARQSTSNFRLSPGEWAPIDTGGRPIAQLAMGMPYHDVTQGLMGMIDRVGAAAEKLAGAPAIPTDEGVANVPVGTMLASIEQATKVLAAAHKGMHTAQSEEFALLIALFKRYPHDFISRVSMNEGTPRDYWDETRLLSALQSRKLAPASDPNVPSHIHRLLKVWALVQLATEPQFTPLTDMRAVYEIALRTIRFDPMRIIARNPPAEKPDPRVLAAQEQARAKMQSDALSAQIKGALAKQSADHKAQLEAEKAARQAEIERASQIAQMRVAQHKAESESAAAQQRAQADIQRAAHESAFKERLALVEAHLKARNDRIAARSGSDSANAKERADGGRVVADEINPFEEILETFAVESAMRTERDARVDQRIEGLAAAVWRSRSSRAREGDRSSFATRGGILLRR